jgi:hypothetical protein
VCVCVCVCVCIKADPALIGSHSFFSPNLLSPCPNEAHVYYLFYYVAYSVYFVQTQSYNLFEVHHVINDIDWWEMEGSCISQLFVLRMKYMKR